MSLYCISLVTVCITSTIYSVSLHHTYSKHYNHFPVIQSNTAGEGANRTGSHSKSAHHNRTIYRNHNAKKKRYISTASLSFYTQYVIDRFFCFATCRYNKLVIVPENLKPALNICSTVVKCSCCLNSKIVKH